MQITPQNNPMNAVGYRLAARLYNSPMFVCISDFFMQIFVCELVASISVVADCSSLTYSHIPLLSVKE